jgi:hypothetical protein
VGGDTKEPKTLSELSDLQEWMAGLLRRRTGLPKDAAMVEAAARHVAGSARVSPVEQLEIYREQFWLRHTASLLEDFPGLSGILGQEDWERLSESYLAEVTPTAWSLRDLGKDLPGHVERAAWLPHHELCVDMARLEWAYVELFDAAGAPPLDAAKLAAIPEEAWATARIVLAPAVALLRVAYPVGELRRKLRESTATGTAVPIPERDPAALVLYRGADLRLYDTRVSDAAFAVLGELSRGVPLVPACERAASHVPDAAEEIEERTGEWFLDWGRRGWVVDVEI